MDTQTLGFALAAGMVAAVNPCGFAMLPTYLALVVGSSVPRALAATVVMSLGFLAVFGSAGFLIVQLATSIQAYLPWATVVVGVAMVLLGAWLVAGRDIVGLTRLDLGAGPTQRLGSMFGYGVAYALASLSCTIAPFLAVTGTTFRSGSIPGGVMAYAAYAGGMSLVVGVLATATALASTRVAARARRLVPHVTRASGALLVLVGLYVAYYGSYEVRLFQYGGDAADPVIEAAGAVQQRLVGWVDALPPLWWAAILVGLVLAGLTIRSQVRKYSESPDGPGR